MKFLLPTFLLLLLSLPASAQIAVSGNVQDVGVANVTSGMQVTFELQNFGGAIPRIPGGPVVGRVLKSFSTDGSGNFTGSLYPNSVIEPQGTWYRVCVVNLGQELRCNKYLINGPFNLSTAVPITPSTNIGPNQFITESFPFTQLTPATTWTVTHNFNDSGTIVFVKGTSGDQIFPDKVNCHTDRNSCVLTFITPTAGFAIAMHAAAINIATNQPNAIIGNAVVPQTIGQDLAVLGNFTATQGKNILNAYNINNILAVDGIKYATLAAAFADCPAAGCTIDMRGNSNPTALALGSFDPGTAPVTLLLGPYGYTLTKITFRNNLHIYGSGDASPAGTSGTVLTQASASTPLFALPPASAGYPAIVAQGVQLSNLVLAPAVASTSDAISIVAAPGNCSGPPPGTGCLGGGLWYSSFDHIQIEPGFGRNGIRVDGTQCDQCSALQFASFRNIWAYRAANAPPVLFITGSYIGQTTFDACEFDLQFGATDTNSSLQNIHIDATPGLGTQTWVPYSIKFQNTTIQFANGPGGVGLYVSGGKAISCDNCHFEGDTTVASFVNGAWGSVIQNSYIDAFSGSGGLINIDGNSSLDFFNNIEGTNPPPGGFLVSGSVPKFLYWLGNMNGVGGAAFSPLPNPGLIVSQLPPAVDAIGESRVINDSTAIGAEGQTCIGGSTNRAMAWSNGSVWKCF